MYYLYNLTMPQEKNLPDTFEARGWTTNPMRFEGKNALLDFWHRYIGSFDMLNVTGKDIYISLHFLDTGIGCDGGRGMTRVEERKLRPYLVVDENGRNVDIRNWTREPEQTNARANASIQWPVMGAKQHWRRMSGPSMRRRTLRDSARDFYTDLDGISLVEVPGVRKKLRISRTDEEIFYCSGNISRSWKDQYKVANQFAKHKPGCQHHRKAVAPADDPWAALAAAGFPLSPATLEAGV